MSQNLSIDDLLKLHELMEDMIVEIRKANWQALTRLDGERRAILGYHINREVGASAAQPVQPPSAQPPAANVVALDAQAPLTRPTANTNDNPSYQQLCASLLDLDRQINLAVKQARLSLVEKNRGLQAQVSAKKGYENANSVQSEAFG